MKELNQVDRKFSREISSGTTSLALLAILAQSEEPMYGYRIAKEISGDGEGFQLINRGPLSGLEVTGAERAAGKYRGALGLRSAQALLHYYS